MFHKGVQTSREPVNDRIEGQVYSIDSVSAGRLPDRAVNLVHRDERLENDTAPVFPHEFVALFGRPMLLALHQARLGVQPKSEIDLYLLILALD